MSNYQFINLSYLEEMSQGDPTTRRTLLEMLQKELEHSVPRLRELYRKQNWEELNRLCHHLKSTMSFAGNDAMIRANHQLWRFSSKAKRPEKKAEAAINFIEAHSRQAKREIRVALERS